MPKAPTLKELKTEIDMLHQIIGIIGSSSTLTSLLLDIARVLANALKCDSCLIYLSDHSSRGLILSGAWPPHPYQVGKLRLEQGEGVTGWVADHKKPVAIARHAGKDARFKQFQNLPEDTYEAFLSVPIILSGETIGVINLQHRSAHTFHQSQVKLVVNIAGQVASAIEKARFAQLAQRKAKQLETISKLSSSIVSTAYLQEILQLIVTMTAQMLDSKICSLMLLDDKTQELRIAATQSLSDEYRKKPPLKVGQSISGLAVKNHKPVAVLDVRREPGYHYPEIARREGLCSMLAVPMFIKGRTTGVINIYTTTAHAFTSEEIDILQTVANQAAIAIENTRLLEESQTAREALEMRKLIERAKGMLMRERQMTEEEAFQFIQRQAMNLRRTMREIAEAILLTEGIRKAGTERAAGHDA